MPTSVVLYKRSKQWFLMDMTTVKQTQATCILHQNLFQKATRQVQKVILMCCYSLQCLLLPLTTSLESGYGQLHEPIITAL